MPNIIKFAGTECRIELDTYAKDGSAAIRLIDTEDGMPLATATGWIEGLEKDEVAIKNYAENEGMYFALLEYGVIEPDHRTVVSGFVTLPICRLKEPYLTEAANLRNQYIN